MTAKVYYNEFDPFAAAWLRKLIEAGEIPKGVVDERSITEVSPKELEDYTQCHFFAGIGGWALALKQAGWGDRPVWTGSCPCQPFSSAGSQKGIKDERHLWPAFFDLISKRKPSIVFGEQVATAIGKGWLDIVFSDLERENYACGAIVFGAHSVGGPHIRQRLYWLGDCGEGRQIQHSTKKDRWTVGEPSSISNFCGLSNTTGTRLEGTAGASLREQTSHKLNNGESSGEERQASVRSSDSGATSRRGRATLPAGKGFWKKQEWLPFRDSKRRPVEPGTFPLAHGFPNRMGTLCGYGNALCVPSAQAFVKAYMEVINGTK